MMPNLKFAKLIIMKNKIIGKSLVVNDNVSLKERRITMEEKQHTYGEFVDLMEELAKQTGNVDAQITIEDWKALATEKQWKEFRPLLLTPDLVINFAEDMVSSFQEHISGTCTDELYMQRKKDGHEFLRKIHEAVVGLGIDIDVRKIDVPLTPTDLLVGAGLAETKDGKIRLTPKGEKLATEEELAMAEKCIIKITSVPEGPGIPEEIRRGWVGAVFEAEGPTEMVVGSAVNPNECHGIKWVYKVPTGLALAALKLQNSKSWEWFKSQSILSPIFGFNAECCEVVKQ